MIYKFKSSASGDVIMLKPNAEQVLALIGKTPPPQGIITVEQLPEAIAALEAALANPELATQESPATDEGTPKDSAERADPVLLRQRIVPFLDLLRRSLEAEAPVVWGV